MTLLSPTLSSYLARHFLIGFGIVILVLLTLGFLAGWAPAGISVMLGVALLFHLEDG